MTAAAALVLAAILLAPVAGAQACPPPGMSVQQLVDLKADGFVVPDQARRQALALDLLPCLGSTDPQLHDGVASTALSKWLRDKQLTAATAGAILERLVVMLQLAVNPRTSKAQLDQMLAAIATQVAPVGEHFYIYGEGNRLAQAVFYIAKRRLHTADVWRKWFEQVSAPAPFDNWGDAWASQRGIAKHQNTMQFLTTLYLYVRESGSDFQDLVLPSLVAAIKPLL